MAYLAERAELVGQKALDQDRQALAILPGVDKLPRIQSEVTRRTLGDRSRAYTQGQVQLVIAQQTARHAFASVLAQACGLRAHELFTLLPVSERSASSHRPWSKDRFKGRVGELYTVCGKGGLVREVLIPAALAERLEAHRREATVQVVDRGIRYTSAYDIGGGQRWSQSWASASRSALGWSTGGHGLRHAFAQSRMDELAVMGMSYRDALAVVSQELGHYRPQITEVYLR